MINKQNFPAQLWTVYYLSVYTTDISIFLPGCLSIFLFIKPHFNVICSANALHVYFKIIEIITYQGLTCCFIPLHHFYLSKSLINFYTWYGVNLLPLATLSQRIQTSCPPFAGPDMRSTRQIVSSAMAPVKIQFPCILT